MECTTKLVKTGRMISLEHLTPDDESLAFVQGLTSKLQTWLWADKGCKLESACVGMGWPALLLAGSKGQLLCVGQLSSRLTGFE